LKLTDDTTGYSLRFDNGAYSSSNFSDDYLKLIDSLPFFYVYSYRLLSFFISKGETLLTTRISLSGFSSSYFIFRNELLIG